MLEQVVRHHVAMMGSHGRRDYVLVFLPLLEQGGESYRRSFALSLDSLPDPKTRATWGDLVAHEMFHLWNGWMLRGADYTSTQWFQEGFTEYSANLAVARSGLVDADWFRATLAQHILTSRRLLTSLEDIGTHKGPPLYSAGALVAFEWDVRIRDATHGRRDLGDFFRALMRRTNDGARTYAWADLRAALEETAPGDWEDFYRSFIHAQRASPMEPALALVGQKFVADPGGGGRIIADPSSTVAAKRLWAQLLRSR
jgi:predicted metalloprotease with PDZ domain